MTPIGTAVMLASGRARGRRRARAGSALGTAFNAGVIVFLLAPIVIMMIESFNSGGYLLFPPQGVSLRWYRAFFDNADFVESLRISLALAFVATLVATTIGVMAALALAAGRSRAAVIVKSGLVAPVTVPGIVTGTGMLIAFSRVNLEGSFLSLAIAHTVLILPFVVLIVSAGLEAFDRSIEEAARSLGAGQLRAFLTVTLPLIRGSLVAAAVLAFLTSFDEVVVSLFLAGPLTTTLPVRIFHYVEGSSSPLIAAVSTLLVLLAGAVVLTLDRTIGFTRFLSRRPQDS
ncbi:MAG TPA: ABC transporter permease [bacterium]|nr:ABC transporter permease [bacterium]